MIDIKIFSGSGNIFSLMDNINYNYNKKYFIDNINKLCNIGINKKTDGLIVINKSQANDFDALFFNPDGTTGMMCGNGGRCAIYYCIRSNKNYIEGELVSFNMNDHIYYGCYSDNKASIYFDLPDYFEERIIKINNIEYNGIFMNINTPHFVIEVEDIDVIDIQKIGKAIRNHKAFAPDGTNANFYQKINKDTIKLRTFERGVEDETGACGTGAIATFITFRNKIDIKDALFTKLTIVPTSKNELYVEYSVINNVQKAVLIGEVEEIIL